MATVGSVRSRGAAGCLLLLLLLPGLERCADMQPPPHPPLPPIWNASSCSIHDLPSNFNTSIVNFLFPNGVAGAQNIYIGTGVGSSANCTIPAPINTSSIQHVGGPIAFQIKSSTGVEDVCCVVVDLYTSGAAARTFVLLVS